MTTLSEKITTLPPDLRREVEDFIKFLFEKHRRLATADTDEAPYWQAASQPTLDTIWANDEDEIYASHPRRARRAAP